MKTKLWDRKGVVTKIRTAHSNKIVSYELDIGGHNGIRHRRYLRKIPVDEVVDVSGSSSLAVTPSAEENSEPVLEQGAGKTMRSSRPPTRA